MDEEFFLKMHSEHIQEQKKQLSLKTQYENVETKIKEQSFVFDISELASLIRTLERVYTPVTGPPVVSMTDVREGPHPTPAREGLVIGGNTKIQHFHLFPQLALC